MLIFPDRDVTSHQNPNKMGYVILKSVSCLQFPVTHTEILLCGEIFTLAKDACNYLQEGAAHGSTQVKNTYSQIQIYILFGDMK